MTTSEYKCICRERYAMPKDCPVKCNEKKCAIWRKYYLSEETNHEQVQKDESNIE